MKFLVQLLSQAWRPVINQPGWTEYDFTLEWTPDQNQPDAFGGGRQPGYAAPADRTVLRSYGRRGAAWLKLNSQKGPVEMLTIVR